jgi:hypothetical protein
MNDHDSDFCFDILRGMALLWSDPLMEDIAEVVARFPDADLSVALNRKQIQSKLFLREHLIDILGGEHDRIWILAGWYGVLAAILFNDPRFSIGSIVSFDRDERCAPVAMLLNRRYVADGRFEARTKDIYDLDYAAQASSLVINTSCEHLPDVARWLNLLRPGTPVVLQSNNYWREPDHLNCVGSVAEFERQAQLSRVLYAGSIAAKNYQRFMLIGYR